MNITSKKNRLPLYFMEKQTGYVWKVCRPTEEQGTFYCSMLSNITGEWTTIGLYLSTETVRAGYPLQRRTVQFFRQDGGYRLNFIKREGVE